MSAEFARIIAALLPSEPAEPIETDDAQAWWHEARKRLEPFSRSIDRAIVGGISSDRLGYALISGYRAALRELVPGLPDDELATFCVTEAGGNHPRAVKARMGRRADGRVVVTGLKRFGTLAPVAAHLVVVASEGEEEERNQLRAIWIDRMASGVTVRPMDELPFVPEVPHAEVELDQVIVEGHRVLAGDGYTDFVKPFRTLEDLHVHAACLAYFVGAARRGGAAEHLVERGVALIGAAHSLADLDCRAAGTHIALAGLLEQSKNLLEAQPGLAGSLLDGAERSRLQRDRGLFSVASGAREKRRERAWRTLTGGLERKS